MRFALDLNFVRPSLFDWRNFNRLGGIVCLTSLIVLVLCLWQDNQVQAEYASLKNQQSILQQKQPPVVKQSAIQSPLISAIEQRSLTQMSELLSLPWEVLFTGIESLDIKDVALLSLNPNPQKHTIELTGQAKNIQAALSFIEHLESLPMLHDVFLQNHEVDIEDPDKPVNFTISGQWIMP